MNLNVWLCSNKLFAIENRIVWDLVFVVAIFPDFPIFPVFSTLCVVVNPCVIIPCVEPTFLHKSPSILSHHSILQLVSHPFTNNYT